MFRVSTATSAEVIQFKRVVGDVTDEVARQYINNAGRSVQLAVSRYLEDIATKEGDRRALTTLWESIRDPDEDVLFEDRLVNFMQSVGAHDDFRQLVVAWKLNCSTLGEIKREEFVEGFAKLGCSSQSDIKDYLQQAFEKLKQTKEFKMFYRWLYKFAAAASGIKTLPTKEVIYLWQVIGPNFPTQFQRMDQWLDFIKERYRGIHPDLWNSIFDFAHMVDTSFDGYNINDAWNTEIDEFVAFCKQQQEQQQQQHQQQQQIQENE